MRVKKMNEQHFKVNITQTEDTRLTSSRNIEINRLKKSKNHQSKIKKKKNYTIKLKKMIKAISTI